MESLANEPIRVLFVVPSPMKGASWVFIRRQIDSLTREGVAARTLALRSRMSPRLLAGDARRFLRAAREFQPQIVHAQYGTMTGFFAAALSPAPLVISFRGADLNPSPHVSVFRSLLGRALSQASGLIADRVICVSEELKGRLLWRRGACEVIPNGVDLEAFTPRPREEARRLLGWPRDSKVVLFNAGLWPAMKRLDLATAVVERARHRHPSLVFQVLDGKQDPASIPLMLSAADCLLLTSDFEGSPNIVKEALACNLPVASVDAGDVRERLAGVKQSVIAGRSAEELGDAVSRILSRGERSDGRAAVEALSLPATAARIAALYRGLLQTGKEAR